MRIKQLLRSSIVLSFSSLVVFIPTGQPIVNHPASIGQYVNAAAPIPKLPEAPQQPKTTLASIYVAPKVEAAPAAPAATTEAPRASGGCSSIRATLARIGVPANQLDSAIKLAMRESTCNEFVVNSIGACGAFQSLPCGKWGKPGTDEYYRGAFGYSTSRYGGFNGALAHSLSKNWY